MDNIEYWSDNLYFNTNILRKYSKTVLCVLKVKILIKKVFEHCSQFTNLIEVFPQSKNLPGHLSGTGLKINILRHPLNKAKEVMDV